MSFDSHEQQPWGTTSPPPVSVPPGTDWAGYGYTSTAPRTGQLIGVICAAVLSIVALVFAGVFFLPRLMGTGSGSSEVDSFGFAVPSDAWADGYDKVWEYTLEEHEFPLSFSQDLMLTALRNDTIRGYSLSGFDKPKLLWEEEVKGYAPDNIVATPQRVYLRVEGGLSVLDPHTGEARSFNPASMNDPKAPFGPIFITAEGYYVCYQDPSTVDAEEDSDHYLIVGHPRAMLSFLVVDRRETPDHCTAYSHDDEVRWTAQRPAGDAWTVDWGTGQAVKLDMDQPVAGFIPTIAFFPDLGAFVTLLEPASDTTALQVWAEDGTPLKSFPFDSVKPEVLLLPEGLQGSNPASLDELYDLLSEATLFDQPWTSPSLLAHRIWWLKEGITVDNQDSSSSVTIPGNSNDPNDMSFAHRIDSPNGSVSVWYPIGTEAAENWSTRLALGILTNSGQDDFTLTWDDRVPWMPRGDLIITTPPHTETQTLVAYAPKNR